MPERIVSVWLRWVRHVEEDGVVWPVQVGNMRNPCDQVSMGINECEAMTMPNILRHHVLDEGRFAGAGLPDDVCVEEAISMALPEPQRSISLVCNAENGDGVGVS